MWLMKRYQFEQKWIATCRLSLYGLRGGAATFIPTATFISIEFLGRRRIE
jgi:hypothetical protein